MSDQLSPFHSTPGFSRITLIAGSVVLFHVAGLWALQSGLLRKAVEVVIPVEILSQIIEPPKAPPSQPPSPPPPPQRQVTKAPPPPRPQAIREPRPVVTPAAPAGVVEPPPPAPPVPTPPSPPAPPGPPPAPPAPKLVELSQGQVQWVRKPNPVYPSISRKLNETGIVVVAVYFNSAGTVKRTALAKSSGFDRLDRAAVDAIQQSQITPLAGGNEETTRLFNAPISFSLSE